MRWIGPQGDRTDITFADLEQRSNRFANILSRLGIQSGEVFFTFLPKAPEIFYALVGALKARIIGGPLFASFGEDALFDRLGDSGACCILTKKSLWRKIARIRDRLPALRQVILLDGESDPAAGMYRLDELWEQASDHFSVPATSSETLSLLHYTSGSTGKPKGVLHCHGSSAFQTMTGRDILTLRPQDIFWCTADQGWITGTSYGMIAPWSLGVTQIHYDGAFSARTWLEILRREEVTVWYSAPTAFRLLRREPTETFSGLSFPALRAIFSVGEPLNPEILHWVRRVFDRDIHDTWFQTETGAIMISNRPGLTIRPGSMGKPVVGIEASVRSDTGALCLAGEQGNLCLRPGWASMFTGYLHHENEYRAKFRDGWYYSGDTARIDAEGYFWFMGRNDDIINTAGHLVSPFEIESSLLELPEIAESGVIGAPDPILHEKIVAFVCLKPGQEASSELEMKIRLHISHRVSTIATPQELCFCRTIPKNRSGKILRRVLKCRYLGLDPGDVSTLEEEP